MIKKGMVFGVFDGLHKGHRHFLENASAQCSELVVVVTRDEVVKTRKNKTAKNSLEKRIKMIRDFHSTLHVIAGDETDGEWRVLKDEKPDVVFLGYDQQTIAQELEKINIPFVFLEAHEPEKYKSSILG